MNYKLLCVLFFVGSIKLDGDIAPQVGDIAKDDMIFKDGSKVVTKYKSVGTQLSEREVLDQLECFTEDELFMRLKGDVQEKLLTEFHGAFDAGIEDHAKHFLFLESEETGEEVLMKMIYWRNDTKQFAHVFVPNPNNGQSVTRKSDPSNFKLVYMIFRDAEIDGECFRILPEGCEYDGSVTDHLEEICMGYDKIAEDLTENIVELSINNPQVNPQEASQQFAECIKEHVKKYTIQMDCAVEGMEMDHTDSLNKLRAKRDLLLADPTKTNVVLDEDRLNLTYEEVAKTESKRVEVNADDFKINN